MLNSTQKFRLLHAGLILSGFIGYMEWGNQQHANTAQVFWQLLMSSPPDPAAFLHPVVLFPLAGIILLFVSAIRFRTWLSYTGMGFLALLMALILFAGVLSLHPGMILSTLPFWILSFLLVRVIRKNKTRQGEQ